MFLQDLNLFENKPIKEMVPRAGLEPAHPKAVDFESTASTNFATQASVNEVHYTDVYDGCKHKIHENVRSVLFSTILAKLYFSYPILHLFFMISL